MRLLQGGFLAAALACAALGNGRVMSQTFTRVESGPVVTTPGDTMGGVWGDYDGDGDYDLAVAKLSPRSVLYLNQGGGVFEEATFPGADLTPFSMDGNALAWCDYDNDGDQDVFVATGAKDHLFERTATGFTQVNWFAGEAGFRIPMTANCVDYDNDGLLDIFVATGGGGTDAVDTLYRNRGGGVFEVIRSGAVVNRRGASGGSSFGDYDGDGWLDLVVPNSWTGNYLYRNDRAGGFEQITGGVVVTEPLPSDGSAWADYDNDGDLDLFISNGADGNNALYRNDGGTFSRILAGRMVNDRGYSVGAAWGDFDNDGLLDLAVANRLGPCFLYRQLPEGQFVSASNVVTQTYADANSVSWADYNGDGFLDLFVGNWRGEGGPDLDFLFRNDGNTNAWLGVTLEGRHSNRSGIGAKVRVRATLGGSEVRQLRQVGGNDSAGANAPDAHFGLGNAEVVDEVRVEWPSGLIQVVTNIAVRQRLHLVEPDASNVVLRAEPAGGVFTNSVRVVLASEPSLRIDYWIQSAASGGVTNVYSGPIVLREAATLRAWAMLGRRRVGEPLTVSFERQYAHAGDGIPDSWRRRWFGNDYSPMDPRVDAEADPDLDGANNLREYAAQTHPLDPASVFKVRVRLVPQIIWDGVPGVTYQVRRRNPEAPGGWVDVGAPFQGVDGVMDAVDATIQDPHGIYVVEPTPPPQ